MAPKEVTSSPGWGKSVIEYTRKGISTMVYRDIIHQVMFKALLIIKLEYKLYRNCHRIHSACSPINYHIGSGYIATESTSQKAGDSGNFRG
jgi:hypothetical protein